MAQALIRNLDDDLLERYRTSAREKGISLEQALREALKQSEPLRTEPAAALKRLSADLRAMTPHEPAQGDSTMVIRWYRDTNGGRWTDDGWAHAAGA